MCTRKAKEARGLARVYTNTHARGVLNISANARLDMKRRRERKRESVTAEPRKAVDAKSYQVSLGEL